MRWRPGIWVLLGFLLLALGLGRLRTLDSGQHPISEERPGVATSAGVGGERTEPVFRVPQKPGLRLANTEAAIGDLIYSPTAVLLENAFVDTASPVPLAVPDGLRAGDDPGSWIIQSRGPADAGFRSAIEQAGGSVVSYVPNNAYLVRGSPGMAQELRRSGRANAVLAYEPYFKLKGALLESVVTGRRVSDTSEFKVLVFAGESQAVASGLSDLGAEILGEERSPFGPVLRVAQAVSLLPRIAGMPGVQEVELVRPRFPANDLSRVALGVSPQERIATNYLGLGASGKILVGVVDTGVDSQHPDLQGRVLADGNSNWITDADTNGHGTHVAGIIAGDGSESETVLEAAGSSTPPAPAQFRGKAPGARLFSLNFQAPDDYLQEAAAATNALISNNSWNEEANEYDLAAASYDAAVRDALPGRTGPQPLLVVFPTGNAGALNRTVITNAAPDPYGAGTVLSPGTAKNVITVGAVEQPRMVTNEVVVDCNGEQVSLPPWESSTDSDREVAFFSGRGNVGIGVEGEEGRFKPDVVAPGTFVLSTRSTSWDEQAYYDPALQPPGTTLEVLSNLNQGLGPYYRYESGSSMAAAQVSGTLALMQEFFQERLGRTNSPALMKALLINGARSLGEPYGFESGPATNHQGWGLINLTNSLPGALSNTTAAATPMILIDQAPERALETGDRFTFLVSVAPAARSLPLRITLVWTDPPANPLAAVKLVNDLDLVVTNVSSGEFFRGNHFVGSSPFSLAAAGGDLPDRVNNVENVYLAPPLAPQYSISTLAPSVNVNAVTAQAGVAQDFAMVIASGDGEADDALALPGGFPPPVECTVRRCVTIPDTFGEGIDSGSILRQQRVAASPPLLATNAISFPALSGQISLGSLQSWRFYQVTNFNGGTNAAFATFMARSLSQPAGPAVGNLPGASGPEADIDLYVSTDHGLTNLEPAAVLTAEKSLRRGGSETVILSNAVPAVYYIGVKCEDQEASEFSLAAVFSDVPFSQLNTEGNLVVRGFPAGVGIPDGGSVPVPAYVLGLTEADVPVRRVVVNDVVSHERTEDLVGTLLHEGIPVVLNNRRALGAVSNLQWVFDDSGQQDISGAEGSDGPGSLMNYAGGNAVGPWVLSQQDVSAGQLGTNEALGLLLEPQPDLAAGLNAHLGPGACRTDLLYVPPEATNLTLTANLAAGTGPLQIELCPTASDGECVSEAISAEHPSLVLVLDPMSDPPLRHGNYLLRSCNTGADLVSFDVRASSALDAQSPSPTFVRRTVPTVLADDALTASVLTVTNQAAVASLSVGVGIEHPRISDLSVALRSPSGKCVLLSQNRGADSANLGLVVTVTNVTPVSSSGGPEASTNTIDTGKTSGTVSISYSFYSLPDQLRVYYESNLIFDSGMVSGSGKWLIPYGPGTSTELTVIVNEGGNFEPDTAWDYVFTSTRPEFLFAQFAENPSYAVTPMKFAVPPFTNVSPVGPVPGISNGLFYLPEQSLNAFNGEMAAGDWTLEVRDSRAGATNPTPALMGWELAFLFDSALPVPMPLSHGIPRTATVRPGHLRFFAVDVPVWASFATNRLLESSLPLNLFYNAQSLPFGTNSPPDLALLTEAQAGTVLLSAAEGEPRLEPGKTYYLSVQNTNPSPVTFTLQVDFDVPLLESNAPIDFSLAASAGRYYSFEPSPDAVKATVQVSNLTANADLVLRRGLPLPTLTDFDYGSFNPDLNDEQIVLTPDSSPIPLGPGRWYVGLINREPGALTGTLNFVEEFAHAIVITEYELSAGTLCLTWTAVPGHGYQVQGRADLPESSPWITLSPVVNASGDLASTCVTVPSGLSFFRVREAVPPGDGAALIRSIQVSETGVLLEWVADAGASFYVQWSPSVDWDFWFTFLDVVTSATGEFSYLDDGSQSGGFNEPRFYRLYRLP